MYIANSKSKDKQSKYSSPLHPGEMHFHLVIFRHKFGMYEKPICFIDDKQVKHRTFHNEI